MPRKCLLIVSGTHRYSVRVTLCRIRCVADKRILSGSANRDWSPEKGIYCSKDLGYYLHLA